MFYYGSFVLYHRKSTVESAPMKDETILYDASNVRFCVLNATASFVWERLDPPRLFDDLVNDVVQEYRVDDRARAERDLDAMLGELVSLSFVASGTAGDAPTPNGSKRLSTVREPAAPQTYGKPAVRVMNESEVLAAFQVTSAGMTWWVM